MAFLQIGLCPISVLCRRLSRLPTRDFSCRVPFLALYPTGHGSEPTVVRDAELRLVTISGLRQLLLDICAIPSLFIPQGHGYALSRGTGKPPIKA